MAGPNKPRIREAALRLTAVLGSTLLTLGMVEVGLRLFHPVELHPTDTFLMKEFRTGREGSMTLVPGAATRVRTPEFDMPVRINSRGLRDREIPYRKPAGVYRILVLGDSQTFGYGVRAEETYAKVLEQRLRSRRVETINTGVPGSGTAHQLHFLETEGWKYAPDAVVLGFFFNDILENKQCRLYAVEDGRIVRIAVPAAEGHSLFKVQGVPENPVDVQAVHGPIRPAPPRPPFLIRYSHLARLARQAASNVKRESSVPDQVGIPARELSAHLLAEVARRCRDRDVLFLTALIPSWEECKDPEERALKEKYREVLRFVERPGEQILDLLPPMRAAGNEALLYPQDRHLNPKGHAVVAAEIERVLRSREPRLRGDAPGKHAER